LWEGHTSDLAELSLLWHNVKVMRDLSRPCDMNVALQNSLSKR
jgi:hypothetical protein